MFKIKLNIYISYRYLTKISILKKAFININQFISLLLHIPIDAYYPPAPLLNIITAHSKQKKNISGSFASEARKYSFHERNYFLTGSRNYLSSIGFFY